MSTYFSLSKKTHTVARSGKVRARAYAAMIGTYCILFCVAQAYAGMSLLARGYSNSELGGLLAIGLVVSFFLQPVLAQFADKSIKAPLLVMGVGLTAVAGFAVTLLLIPGYSLPVAIVFVAFQGTALSCQKLLKFSAVFFVVKGLVILSANSMVGLYFGFCFQAFSYAIFLPASARYAGEIAMPQDTNKAQAYVTATVTAGNIAASALGGIIIDHLGLKPALALLAAFAFAGMTVMLFGLRGEKKTNYVLPTR